jgi:hypothetical protein
MSVAPPSGSERDAALRERVRRLVRMVWQEALRTRAAADAEPAQQWLTYAETVILTTIEQERYLAVSDVPRATAGGTD